MNMVNVHEAKTHLSRLLQRVVDGEEIVIAKAGEPVARLVPYRPVRDDRQPGLWRGKISVVEGFDAMPDEVDAAFRGDIE